MDGEHHRRRYTAIQLIAWGPRVKRLAGELFVIVTGILLALGVDEWRQDREEIRVVEEHLTDIAAEMRSNLCTVERVRVRQWQRKSDGLQSILRFLGDPKAVVDDPAALLQAFARSSAATIPWLVDNQYQALQNSGNARLVDKLQPGLRLAGVYEGPEVLFAQVDRLQGAYPVVVHELIPAQLQPEISPLHGYFADATAPALEDDGDLVRAVERIRGRRIELLDLARNEAAVTTAKWYALQRLKRDYEVNLAKLEPWDRDTTPLAELYATCKEGVGRPTPTPTK